MIASAGGTKMLELEKIATLGGSALAFAGCQTSTESGAAKGAAKGAALGAATGGSVATGDVIGVGADFWYVEY